MTVHEYPVGATDRAFVFLAKEHADEWDVIRRFMPTLGESDPVVVASLGLVDRSGFVATGDFPDGRHWGVQPLTFGQAQLGVWEGEPGGHDDCWDYSNVVLAVLAAGEWAGLEPEPRWWKRHPKTGRRRAYHADGTAIEYRLADG